MSGDWLQQFIDDGTISADQLNEAEAIARNMGIPVEKALVQQGYIEEEVLAQAKARQFGFDYVNLDEMDIPQSIIELVPESVARENIVIPVASDGEKLKVAVQDPMNFEVVEKLRFILNRDVDMVMASKEGILTAINRSYGYNWQLNLNVPLFTGGLNSSRIQQSVYEHRATLEASERVARETERQTRDAYLGVVSSISQVQALARFVESAETALRATEAGFEVGTRTSVDVLVSQENLRQAQTQYARSRYDYILNVLRLRQSAGSLSVDDVEQVDGWLQ